MLLVAVRRSGSSTRWLGSAAGAAGAASGVGAGSSGAATALAAGMKLVIETIAAIAIAVTRWTRQRDEAPSSRLTGISPSRSP